jgi:hypothetical protein
MRHLLHLSSGPTAPARVDEVRQDVVHGLLVDAAQVDGDHVSKLADLQQMQTECKQEVEDSHSSRIPAPESHGSPGTDLERPEVMRPAEGDGPVEGCHAQGLEEGKRAPGGSEGGKH